MPASVIAEREAEFRSLWRQGYTQQQLAAHFGCSRPTVIRQCQRMGLRRSCENRALTPAPNDVLEDKLAGCILRLREAGTLRACDFWTLKRDIELAETAGGYAALAGLAARWKVAQSRLLARWHLMRGHLGGIHAKP